MQWYMGRVQRATHRSAYATNQFYRVINFLDSPAKLFAPRMLIQALLAGFGTSQSNSVSPNTLSRQATHTDSGSCRKKLTAVRANCPVELTDSGASASHSPGLRGCAAVDQAARDLFSSAPSHL
jgi:hypothetical protein